jgi:protein-tyrosine phosphatase
MQVEIAWKERRKWHIRVQLQPAPAVISTPMVEPLSYTGLIDVHSHVLWGLDDGSASIEDSLAMLRSASEHGTAVIVATPHSNAEYSYQQELIEARILELIAHSGGNPRLLRGCDFHLSFDNIDVLLDQPSKYTINSKQYLLVECPDSSVGRHTESVFNRLLDARIVPIVTHPERNPILQRKLSRVEAWVEQGCLVQVTALSITGGFGRSAKSAARKLLARGLVHIVASDAHDPANRHPRLDEAYAVVQSLYGQDAAEFLFYENPHAVVEGLSLPGGKQVLTQSARSWWPF